MQLNKHEEKYKEYLKLKKRYNKVWDLLKDEPLIKLDKPYQSGWIISYVAADNIRNQYKADEIQELIDKYYSKRYTKDVKVIQAIRRGDKSIKRSKKISLVSDYLPGCHTSFEYKDIITKYKDFYYEVNNYYSKKLGKTLYSLNLPKNLIKVKVRPNMITHTQGKNRALESEKFKLFNRLWCSDEFIEFYDHHYQKCYPRYIDRPKYRDKINKFKNGDIEDIYNEKIPLEYKY